MQTDSKALVLCLLHQLPSEDVVFDPQLPVHSALKFIVKNLVIEQRNEIKVNQNLKNDNIINPKIEVSRNTIDSWQMTVEEHVPP
jgi:hypothetical protein